MVIRVAKVVLVAVATLALLLVVTGDPGHGTQVNLHSAADVGAQVGGAHHAKTIPHAEPVVLEAMLVATLAVIVVLATPLVRRRRHDDELRGLRSVLGRGVEPRRGPPLPFAV